MFQYVIVLVTPSFEDLNSEDENSNSEETNEDKYNIIQVAISDFNLGLSIGEKVWIWDDTWGTQQDKRFNFETTVVKIEKVIICGRKSQYQPQPNTFKIVITLEAIEKENLARMKGIVTRMKEIGYKIEHQNFNSDKKPHLDINP